MSTDNHTNFAKQSGTARSRAAHRANPAGAPRTTRRIAGALRALSVAVVGVLALGDAAVAHHVPQPGNASGPLWAQIAGPGRQQNLTDWTQAHSRRGTVQLRPSAAGPGGQSFYISGNVGSTAWVGSPPLNLRPPYRVTFWVHVSSRRYNGFSIYDAVDTQRRETDMRVYLHDDRGDRTAQGGWHGALWVRDGVGRYSVTTVPRNQWVKFTVHRRLNNSIVLYMNGRQVGTFASRSALPLRAIERIGDINRKWWHGEASWGPVHISP